jgi:hypothetical protein
MDSSQHVQAFLGHLLTNETVRDEAKAATDITDPAARSEAMATVINKHLGTSLTPEEATAVASQTADRLAELKADPKTPVDQAHANIIGGPY